MPAFYWKLLAAEGVRPQLDVCVRCGEAEPLVAFDLDEGGVLCRACRSGSAISPEALALMRLMLGGRLNDALAVPASPATHEVSTLATRALEHHIERRLRTVAMFEHDADARGPDASVAWRAAMAATDLEQIVNLCKRRGFVYPSAEIYGGFRSSYDYGPLGSLMLRNVRTRGSARWSSSATTSC